MNCSFNIRYKPRTTRSYTKSDLTVYDSAGNTALNALTVYGKSEVVDGSIKSAGEGWNTVDLGTLEWTYNTTTSGKPPFFIANIENSIDDSLGLCYKYNSVKYSNLANYCMCIVSDTLRVCDSTYTDATIFKTAMSGVMLCYELADPTQGNAIAVKADNGTGISGTMAVFETGTPLRGIPNTDVRDVMEWNGSAGVVTKNCGKVKLSDLNWSLSARGYFLSDNIDDAKVITGGGQPPLLIPNYTPENFYNIYAHTDQYDKVCAISNGETTNPSRRIYIIDKQYATVADFTQAINALSAVYELDTPITTPLTTVENASIAGLRTFAPQTHAQNNVGADMTIDYTIKVPTI